MILLILLTTLFSFADSPGRWEYARSIVDRHEFYTNGEEVTKPANSWQVVFAVTFLDSSFRNLKDCVYYRVPGDEAGKIKIRTLSGDKDCSSEILAPGEKEFDNISKFRFFINERSVLVEFIRNTKPVSWEISFLQDWKKPEARSLLSSADFRSPRMIFLSPAQDTRVQLQALKDGTICHEINQDCQVKTPSRCHKCEHGWQEIPNGCLSGPKICGAISCGRKDLPACRRGMIWQRKEIQFDCRIDSSFAWCAKGLSVNCDGDKAYCR